MRKSLLYKRNATTLLILMLSGWLVSCSSSPDSASSVQARPTMMPGQNSVKTKGYGATETSALPTRTMQQEPTSEDAELSFAEGDAIPSKYKVSVSAPDGQVVNAGSSTTYQVTVTNQGTEETDYYLNLSSTPADWTSYRVPTSVHLHAGESYSFNVSVNVPADAQPTSQHRLDVAAHTASGRTLDNREVYTTVACDRSFTDVPVDSPLYKSVLFTTCHAILNSEPSSTEELMFNPSGHLSEAELCEAGKAFGLTNYVFAATEALKPASRAEVALVLVKARGYTIYDPPEATYNDVAETSTIYKETGTLVLHHVLDETPCSSGVGICFRPDDLITRAEFSEMVYQAFGE